jgi:uncharacterized protein
MRSARQFLDSIFHLRSMFILLIAILFFVIAFFYSSVGFGGGSSYLAILSLALVEFHEIRTLALVLNLAVVLIGTSLYLKNRVVDWKAFWPFIVCSIPVAFLGAQFKLSETVFFVLLGGSLFAASLFMIIQVVSSKQESRELSLTKKIALGSGIGLLSGMVGIGGGIFLSPTLNLLGWRTPRTIAALAAVFILSNSAAGLLGLLVSGSFELNLDWAWPLLAAVVVGGILGSTFSIKKFNNNIVRAVTALLVGYVGSKLILLHGFEIYI